MGLLTLSIECDTDKVSDGYHTFGELYEHRCLLFIGLMRSHPQIAWRAEKHADGSTFGGWFIAGMELPTGPITYHLPQRLWPLLDDSDIGTLESAPEWDGHTSKDVIQRLWVWLDTAPRRLHVESIK